MGWLRFLVKGVVFGKGEMLGEGVVFGIDEILGEGCSTVHCKTGKH